MGDWTTLYGCRIFKKTWVFLKVASLVCNLINFEDCLFKRGYGYGGI